jgi:hypothetical protein
MGYQDLRLHCSVLDFIGIPYGQGPSTKENRDPILCLTLIPQASVRCFLVSCRVTKIEFFQSHYEILTLENSTGMFFIILGELALK